MKRGKNLFFLIFLGTFLSIGLILGAISGVVYYKHQQFINTANNTTATIVDINFQRDFDDNRKGHVYIEYTIDDKDYVNQLNYYSSTMQIGDEITIYYQPDDPEKITYKSNVVVITLAILGTVFSFIGSIGFILLLISKKGRDNLLKHGHKIYAELTEIAQDPLYTINNRHPYRIFCRYQDSYGSVHLFKSEIILYNPKDFLKDNMIPVYVKAANYKKYYVKIDEVLPKQVSVYN